MSNFKRKKSDGHPKYIHDTENGTHGYTGITRHSKTFGKKNIRLHRNPNPRDKAAAFARNEYKRADVDSFKDEPQYHDWELDPRDKPIMDKLKSKKRKQ